MKPLVALVGAFAAISCVVADGCWKTGCNLNNWAVVGCSPYGMEERSKEACNGGWIYECCPYGTGGGSGGGGSDGGSGGGGGGDGGSGGGSGGDGGSGGGGGSDGGSGGGSGGTAGDVAEITYEQFQRAITGNGYPDPGKEKYDIFIASAGPRGAINTKVEAAMALAQFLHESDGLRAKREYACASSQCPGSYATPGCDAHGQYYFGRGYIQLSWCYNYRPASMDLYGDDRLVHDPDMVAREEQVAWETAFWYWKTAVHNQAGVSEGKFGVTTRAINGALECWGGYVQQAVARFEIYKKVRLAFGITGTPDERGCYN